MKKATLAVHAGNVPDPQTGAVALPIYMTSTFAQESPGVAKGYEYTRAHNPNFTILEEQLSALEEAKYATVFSSGLGALTGLLSTLKAGDTVAAIEGVYGGTYRLFTKVFEKLGIGFSVCNPGKPEGMAKLEELLKRKPKWLLFETPTNPLLELFDIEQLSAAARKHGVPTLVDNTFASPYCQNPLKWGADAVWHSTTKYLGGHSDVVGGVIITNNGDLKEELDFARKATGVNPSPFDAWLVTRGVKTLAVRMERHMQNAMAIAQHLENHPKIQRVYYPGLPSHPGHAIAKKQMHGFSGMVSAEFNLPLETMKTLIASLSLFTLAESLGGVESLICHPATMTHASVPPAERNRIGLSDGLVRISVGIEDKDDLIRDLDSALSKVS